MKKTGSRTKSTAVALPRCPTGIQGLDEITGGGLPRGRPTLVCGAAGCGKTLLAAEFLIRGALQLNEPGVFMSFEESEEELKANVASLGFDLEQLVQREQLLVDHVHIERSEIEETGEFDLEGLFVRLNYAIDSIGARRVVLDTLEALFAGLPNEGILRAELRRLFRWLKDKGVTAVITAERGAEQLTRHGIEEYVSDCVILLDHRVHQQIATRHLRVVKYRGALHGTNEYPFLIAEDGISVLPITSMELDHPASSDRIPTGIDRLDTMLSGKGFFRGSSILITGTPGTGKSSVSAFFAAAAAGRGERVLYFAFEESPDQIIRNMRSVNLRLKPLVQKNLLRFHAARPTLYGLEMHLAVMLREIRVFQPEVVIVDPLTSLTAAGIAYETKAAATRLIDFLKAQRITSLFTTLTNPGPFEEMSEVAISSLMDTWILLQEREHNGERNRMIYVLKSRGMAHSNQVREFIISDKGVDLIDAHIGYGGVLTGTARVTQVLRDEADRKAAEQEAAHRKKILERKRQMLEMHIAALKSEYEAEVEDIRRREEEASIEKRRRMIERVELARTRQADTAAADTRASTPKTKSRR